MAKRKEISEELKELRLMLQENRLVIGSQRVIKLLHLGKLSKIFLANNVEQERLAQLTHQAKLAKVEVVTLNFSNEELGVFCKKNYFISVAGVLAN